VEGLAVARASGPQIGPIALGCSPLFGPDIISQGVRPLSGHTPEPVDLWE